MHVERTESKSLLFPWNSKYQLSMYQLQLTQSVSRNENLLFNSSMCNEEAQKIKGKSKFDDSKYTGKHNETKFLHTVAKDFK